MDWFGNDECLENHGRRMTRNAMWFILNPGTLEFNLWVGSEHIECVRLKAVHRFQFCSQYGAARRRCCVPCSWCHCRHEAFLFCCLSSLLVFGRSSAFVSCERQSHVAVCMKLSGVTWWRDIRCVSSPLFPDTCFSAKLCGSSTTCDLMFDRRSLEWLAARAQKFSERDIRGVS